jgi:GTPase Era involved in 16S rRNA processing
MRELAAELIREQCFRNSNKSFPMAWRWRSNRSRTGSADPIVIKADLSVEKDNQKGTSSGGGAN